MKKFFQPLFVCLILVSCSKTSQDDLLTSAKWMLDASSPDAGPVETLTFKKDGGYLLEGGAIKVNGKWSRTADDEIQVMVEGMSSDNGDAKFDKTANYNVRILDISHESLRILEKGEGDSWESAFAKEKKYEATH